MSNFKRVLDILNEDKKTDFEKVVKVIKSAKTKQQLISAMNMAKNYTKTYGETFIEYIKGVLDPFYSGYKVEEFIKIIKTKEDKISFNNPEYKKFFSSMLMQNESVDGK